MTDANIQAAAPEPRRSRARKRGVALFLTLSLTAVAATQSLAVFTNTADSSTDNLFDNGSIEISTNKPAQATITLRNMAPGDTQTGSIVVTNSGTLNLRYAMRSAITADTKPRDSANCASLGAAGCLSNKVILTIKEAVNSSCASFAGTTLYTGPLAGSFIGSNAQGSNAGDRVLAAAAFGANPAIANSVGSETLCFAAHLPLMGGTSSTTKYPNGPADDTDTDNSYILASTSASFTFDAEQTSNNP